MVLTRVINATPSSGPFSYPCSFPGPTEGLWPIWVLFEPTLMPPSWTMLTSGLSLVRTTQVINVCSDQRLLDSLRDCNKLLDMVQKGLSEYLETKRRAFPR